MKFAKISAIVALIATVGVSAFAKPNTPPAAPTKTAASSNVKSYTRKTKSGKVISVKGYTRKPKTAVKAPKTVAVKGYDRKTKSGKVVHVKGYTRKVAAPKKGAAPKMDSKMKM